MGTPRTAEKHGDTEAAGVFVAFAMRAGGCQWIRWVHDMAFQVLLALQVRCLQSMIRHFRSRKRSAQVV
eukprot:3251967-Pleurochrysis_carterae.AAC.1